MASKARTEASCLKSSVSDLNDTWRLSCKALRDGAWDQFVAEYTSAIDDDPSDARTRYFATIQRIEAMENGK